MTEETVTISKSHYEQLLASAQYRAKASTFKIQHTVRGKAADKLKEVHSNDSRRGARGPHQSAVSLFLQTAIEFWIDHH